MPDIALTIPIVDDDLFDPETNPRPGPSVQMPLVSEPTLRAYLYTGADLSEWPVSAVELGRWDETTGEPLGAIGADYWSKVARLGNENRRATGPRDTIRWQGHSQEKWETYDAGTPANNRRYPVTQDPFTIEVVRTDNRILPTPDAWDSGTTYAEDDLVTHAGEIWSSLINGNTGNEPGTNPVRWEIVESGYGWTATMLREATSRPNIVNYKMGIYPDENCTPGTEIYFTGAFQDAGGGVFTSSAPDGQWTADADAVYFALIYSPGPDAQEGIATLAEGAQEITLEFWDEDSLT